MKERGGFPKDKNMLKRKHFAFMAATAILCAVVAQAAFAADGAPKPEPVWYPRLKIAVPRAEKAKKPILLVLGLTWDPPSWELRQRVFATDEFRAVADKFVLCYEQANNDELKAMGVDVAPADMGAVVFLTPELNELERVRFNGDSATLLSVIKRVAEGNSIAELRAKIGAEQGKVEALTALYKAYAERRDATQAIEILGLLKTADAGNAKSHETLSGFWGVALLEEKGQEAEALKEIERILPDVTDAALRDELVLRRMMINYQTGDKDAAIGEMRKFIAENPGSPRIEKAYQTLFTALAQAGKNGEAAEALAQALKAAPESRFAIESIFGAATNLYNAKQYEQSARMFEMIAGKARGIAACEQADIMYRAMTKGAGWKKRLLPERKALDVMYVAPDTATFLYYISLWDAKTYFPVFVNSGSEQDKRLIQRFAAFYGPSRIIVAPARDDLKADEATAMRAVLASWRSNDLDAQGDVRRDDFKRELERLGIAPMGIVFADAASEGLLAGGAALAAGRFELLDFFHADDDVSKVIDPAGARKLRAEIAEKVGRWGYEHKHSFDDIDFVTFACTMPMKFKGVDWYNYNVDDFVTRRDDEVRFAYPGRLMEGITRANYMAMCAMFLQPGRALFFDAYNLGRPGFGEYGTDEAVAAMKEMMPTEQVTGNNATVKKWRELMGRVNPRGYLHINSSGGGDTWWVAGGVLAKLEDMPAESAPSIVHMTHSYSASEPWNEKTIAGKWLNAGAYIYFGSNCEPYLTAFRTPSRIAVSIKEGEPLSQAYRPGFSERFWVSWRLCYMGDPMFVLTGKRAEKGKAADIALRKGEKEVKKVEDVFGGEKGSE